MAMKLTGWSALVFSLPLLFIGCEAQRSTPSPAASEFLSGTKSGFTQRSVAVVSGVSADVRVSTDRSFQTIEGFGGAFNEKGWQALSVLAENERQKALRMLFDPAGGIALTVCRVPIGASDYAMDRYTEDETPGDYAMGRFSIDRDREMLIPFVKAAQAIQPGLRLWASAWTPPTWMKSNGSFDSGSFKDEPRIYGAYSLYLARFIKAYQAEGIPVEAVAVQNEPRILTAYPSCSWTGSQYLTFIRDYMGPLFEKEGLRNAIMLGTFNQVEDEPHLTSVLDDPTARSYVSIIGLQWSGYQLAPYLGRARPVGRIWQTETDCGNHHWEPGFDADKPQNDFSYALATWQGMRRYLEMGVSVYDMWNMVLDQTGKSIDADRPWPQNSAVVVDQKTRSVHYTPMFFAFGSFSRYVPPGSKRLGTAGAEAVAFADPRGRTVVVMPGREDRATNVTVQVRGTVFRVEIPRGTFATLVVAAPG